MKLTIELVPKTAWYNNLRSQFTKEQWDFIRKYAYKRAGYKCEICGDTGDNHPIEAHEEWHYNDKNHTMTLDKVTALCPACHQVKHIGLAKKRGKLDEAIEHFIKVNGCTKEFAITYINVRIGLWKERSKSSWTLDIKKQQDWIRSKVPDSAQAIELQGKYNVMQIELQKQIEQWGNENLKTANEKRRCNELFNEFFTIPFCGHGLEESLKLKLEHYALLSVMFDNEPKAIKDLFTDSEINCLKLIELIDKNLEDLTLGA